METLAHDSAVEALSAFLGSIEEPLSRYELYRMRLSARAGDEEGAAIIIRMTEPSVGQGVPHAYELVFSALEQAQLWGARKLVVAHERRRLNEGHAVLEHALKVAEKELNSRSIREAMDVLRGNEKQACAVIQATAGRVVPDKVYQIVLKDLDEECELLPDKKKQAFAI